MRLFLWAILALSALSAGIASAEEKGVAFEGTAKEVGPSPYAKQGGIGRIVLEGEGGRRIVFHIMKDTTITRMVDGKPEKAKFADIKKGDQLRATHDGQLMQSNPPQAWTIKLQIVKAAE